MNKETILDEYFLEARSNLLDLAAFMDRLERADGQHDYRSASIIACFHMLHDAPPEKTRRILERLSDPSSIPVEKATGKGASGAWPGFTHKV